MSRNAPLVHAGNYYTFGAKRLVKKLVEIGIAIPSDALAHPLQDPDFAPRKVSEFSRLELALLDWFEDRDYDQAQALIHFRPPTGDWHAIYALDEDRLPGDVTDGMLCPTLRDALGAVIAGCDQDVVRLDECRKTTDGLTVVIDGHEALRVSPIQIEAFDLLKRDRVRTAFKGVRRNDFTGRVAKAERLPGYKGIQWVDPLYKALPDFGMLFGFPGNWAYAMRSALKQVNIDVKISAAQDLAAVFFGGESWHQLIKHQDVPNAGTPPVEVSIKTKTGIQRRFYASPEEAVFALGYALRDYPEPMVIRHFEPTLMKERVSALAIPRQLFEEQVNAPPLFETYEACIESGANDYWDLDGYGTPLITKAAQQMLNRIHLNQSSEGDIHGADKSAKSLLEDLLQRDGVPVEQITYAGDYAFAVRYVDSPNGPQAEVAQLQIFKTQGEHLEKLKDGAIQMYKAEVTITERPTGILMRINPDYGHGPAIEIPFENLEQVNQLLALTHADGLFTMRRPEVEVITD